MFDDPALVLACDLPTGWCLDPESSLFRFVFRPWDRLDERVIVTVLPTATAPTAADEDWSDVTRGRLELGGSTTTLTLTCGVALAAELAVTDDSRHVRVARRGRWLDVVADYLAGSERRVELPPVLLRIATSIRAPARSPRPDAEDAASLEEARAAAEALPEAADAASIVQALLQVQNAAEERWLRSLLRGSMAQVDLDAFDALVWALWNLGRRPSDPLSLRRAHAMLMRAVPGGPPTGSYIPVDEELRPTVVERFEGKFSDIARSVRRRPEAQPFAHLSDDQFGSDFFIQRLLGRGITEAVRAAFERDERVRPEAANEAVLAQLGSIGMYALASERPEELVDDLWQLGRALTAYLEAAVRADDRDHASEAAQVLTAVGERLFEIASRAPGEVELYRRHGAAYAASGLYYLAEILIRAADRPSLGGALSKIDEAYSWLSQAPVQPVDEVNACRVDALAALQLGDAERARAAVERGAAAAARLGDERELGFFKWADSAADLVDKTPSVMRTVPELQYALTADRDPADRLETLCAALEQELSTDPVGVTTIERLVLAARLVGEHASETLIAAAESLLDLKRLLVSQTRDIQVGGDDSLLARRVVADVVAHRVSTRELAAALAAADRGRARSLLLDLQLRPGETAQLQDAIDRGFTPGDRSVIDAMLHDRVPEALRWLRGPPSWAGLDGLRSMAWLRRLGGELVDWVSGLTDQIGTAPLTPTELIACAQVHGQPILVFHPTEDRVALFVVTPGGEVHHAWSPVSTSEVLAQAEQLRDELGVWVSARQRGRHDWSAAADDGVDAYRAAAAAAYQSLLAPVREHLAGHARLTIVPYRELGALPYALLEDEAGTPLLEQFAITTVPSIATLALLKRRCSAPSDPPVAYVVGDPAAPGMDRLPGAAREARSVRAVLKAAHPELAIRHRADRVATPDSYLREAQGASFVHLSCHAGVGTTASASALYLAPDPGGDGTLDVTRIASVPLANALVFLAACRSGTGRAAADGTVGLAREFLRAGASVVVASYWKVSDEATRVLVGHFYDALLRRRVDVAEALRDAMRAARTDLSDRHDNGDAATAHPGGWGPFFVLGDGTLRDDV